MNVSRLIQGAGGIWVMTRYTVYFNGEQVKSYELDEPVIFIGRLPENHIPISNMGISRRHVKIELDPSGEYSLADLNSLNGTLVNGKKVKRVSLSHGDKITIGKYTILYEDFRGIPPGAAAVASGVKPEGQRDMADAADIPVDAPIDISVAQLNAAAGKHKQSAAAADDDDAAQNNAPVLIETTGHVVYKLDRTYFTVGSDDEDDIYANGFMVSKGYAAVEQQRDGNFYISGLKVMTKLKINGKNIKKHKLRHGDRIEIGSNTFRFMENGKRQ
jgi:pSer/pThr/pTyr-binding forkhead associated (FHA) protein